MLFARQTGKLCSALKGQLELATKKSHFIFDDDYYDQIDGGAMHSPLEPVLANIFMCHFEETGAPNESVPHIICSPEESCWLAKIQVFR